MPIYEYESVEPKAGCGACRKPFEIIQSLNEPDIQRCPDCHGRVRKIVSRCRIAIAEESPEYARVENRIREHEKSGRYSHAAELADSFSEQTKDAGLKSRALDNYAKAGYSHDTLNKFDKDGA